MLQRLREKIFNNKLKRLIEEQHEVDDMLWKEDVEWIKNHKISNNEKTSN